MRYPLGTHLLKMTVNIPGTVSVHKAATTSQLTKWNWEKQPVVRLLTDLKQSYMDIVHDIQL